MKTRKHTLSIISLLLVVATTAQSDTGNPSPTKSFTSSLITNDVPAYQDIDIARLTAQATLDNDNKFEAILFDHQSQVTLGHLYWNQDEGTGQITLEYNHEKTEIDIQIADLSAMTSFERYDALLSGLQEIGRSWLMQLLPDTISKSPDTLQRSSTGVGSATSDQPTGFFDIVSPQFVMSVGSPEKNFNRVAGGWSYDPNKPSISNWVHIYASYPGKNGISITTHIASVYANKSRPDVNRVLGISGNHGWSLVIPESWDADGLKDNQKICGPVLETSDGKSSVKCATSYFAYGLDITRSTRTQLHNSPKAVSFSTTY